MLGPVSKLARFFLATCAFAAAGAYAQGFPNKRISVIVGAAAGTYSDLMCRILVAQLELRFKQPVTLENKSGAGGYIANDAVARANPDGYTLLCAPEPTLYSDLFTKGQRSLLKELTLLGGFGSAPLVVIAPTTMKMKNLKEFVSEVKANPKKYNVETIVNTADSLEALWFLRSQGLDMPEVSFVNRNQMLLSISRSDIHFMVAPISAARPVMDSGAVVPLATTGSARIKQMPDVATAKEQGSELEIITWFGFFSPNNLPNDVSALLKHEFDEGMSSPAAVSSMATLGAEPLIRSVGDLQNKLTLQNKRYAEIISTLNIKQ